MVMNGYDTDGDGENNFYSVNGRAFYYAKYPIRVKRSETLRIYLANLTEFDLDQLLPPPRRVLPLLPHRQHRPVRVHGHGDAVPGRARDRRDRLAQRRPLHVPRPPVGVHRPRLDGLLRGRSTSEHRVGRPPAAAPGGCACWRWCRSCCWSASPPRSCQSGGSITGLVGSSPPPADAFDVRRVEFHPGEIRVLVRNPQPEDLTIAVVTVDDAIVPVHPRRRRHPRPPALAHDHDPVHVGRGRPVPDRRHQLDGHPDDARGAGRRRDAGRQRPQRRGLRADRPAGGRGARGARDALAARRCAAPTRAGWPAFMALTGGLLTFLAVDALAEALELQAALPGALGGPGLVLLGVALSYLGLTWVAAPAARAAGPPPSAARPWRAWPWRRWSPSASACTTWARAWRSARRSRSASWPSARS